MGVRGLTTYINSNQNVFMKKHYLYDTKLIIDGLSLSAQLYRCLNCFSAFGGDYDKYAAYVKTFFKNLKKCNITPYVIFDGSYERRKLKTVFSRLRNKLKNASILDPVTQGSITIFPLLLRDVFKDVLIEMNIDFMVCEFEADDEIASLARLIKCPVLSYDSDFFIYNVLYIPFNTLELKSKPIEIEGEKRHVMECKLFEVKNLIRHFGGIQEEVLPLLAILLGNDFIEKRVFRKFFSQLKQQKSKRKKNDQQRNIHTLFNWFQNETLESAILKILGRLKKKEKDRVLYIIRKGIEGYNSKKCQSLSFFKLSCDNISNDIEDKVQQIINEEGTGEDKSGNDNESESSESEECIDSDDDDEECQKSADEVASLCSDNGLPNWFVTRVQDNKIPMTYLNLYTNHIQFCSPQADDYSEEDSFICTLPILRYAFDILTDFTHDYCVYVGTEGTNYKKIFVEKEYAISRPIDKLYKDLTLDELHACFKHFLNDKMPNLDLKNISLLPTNFQLYMIAIIWWVANCTVPLIHIHSLFICYIVLDVIDDKTGTTRGHFQFNNKNSKKLEELRKNVTKFTYDNELYLNKNKVQYEDCLMAASVLLKHFEIDDSIRKKPKSYDKLRMHSFAQFQYCLQQLNSLNIVCGLPFAKSIYSKCYNGTFIYNMALKMEKQNDPEQFIEQYLSGAPSVLSFYKSICSIFKNIVDEMSLTTTGLPKKKPRYKNKKNDDAEIMHILRGLESDVVI